MIINWMGNKVFVSGWEPNAPNTCEMCHQSVEGLRPYGPDGAWICIDCAEKDRVRTENYMKLAMDPADFVVTTGMELHKISEEAMLSLLDAWLTSDHEIKS